MARGITITGTTGTATASGGTVAVNHAGLPNAFIITKIKIQPSAGSGPFTAEFFAKDTLGGADLLGKGQSITGNLYEPSDRSSGSPAEGRASRGVIWYEDEDATGELHFKITNNDTSDRTYSYTIVYEEFWVINSSGLQSGRSLSLSGTLSVTGHVTLEGVTSSGATGTGKLVFDTSPILATPNLGTPSAGILTNCTGFPVAQLAGLAANVATFLATPSSANLAAAVTDETGSGALVFATSPTLTTPLLGTPTSGNLSNCTGFPAAQLGGLGTGVATFLATPSSANLAAAITDETGSGALVFGTSPNFTTNMFLGGTGSTGIQFYRDSGDGHLEIRKGDNSGYPNLLLGQTQFASDRLYMNGTGTNDVQFFRDGADGHFEIRRGDNSGYPSIVHGPLVIGDGGSTYTGIDAAITLVDEGVTLRFRKGVLYATA